MDNGWIKLHRSLTEKGYYSDSHYVHLWVHMIIKANHKEKEFLFNGKLEKVERGQFISGILQLSRETGINKSKVERILKVFESEKQIERVRTNRFSLFTILSYEQHQSDNNRSEKPVRSQREASEKPVRTNKNERMKECNKTSNKFEEFWSAYNKKRGKKKSETIWNKKVTTDELAEEIINKAKLYSSTRETQYQKDPERWLRDECWNDEELKRDIPEFEDDSKEMKLTNYLMNGIRKVDKNFNVLDKQNWCYQFNQIINVSNRTYEQLAVLITFVYGNSKDYNGSSFWKPIILSPEKIEQNFIKLKCDYEKLTTK